MVIRDQARKATSARTLHPSTEAAQAFARDHAEVRHKLAELEDHKRRLIARGRSNKRERRSLARQIQSIDAEAAGLQVHRRIYGFLDAWGEAWFFDRYAGDRVIRWIETHCVFTLGAFRGKPFILAPWQKKLIRQLFGWKRPDGLRRFSEAWIEVPRKNGKSELAAAIALYLLIADREGAPHIFSIAGNHDQAKITYDRAKAMVELNPVLEDIIDAHKLGMLHEASGGSFQALGANNQHGKSPHGVIGDEVHEWRGRDQYDAFDTADGGRRQPIKFYITTAGDDYDHLCGELHLDALQILAQRSLKPGASVSVEDRDRMTYQPHVLVRIYTVPHDMDWRDERAWYRANPGLAHGAPTLRSMQEGFRKSVGKPAKEYAFKRFRLNMWLDSVSAWIPRDRWTALSEVADWSVLDGADCYAGLDLAKVKDLSALVLLFTPDNRLFPGKWVVLTRFWCPQAIVESTDVKDDIDYQGWVDGGHLKSTPGETTDFDILEADIIALAKRYNIIRLGYDRFLAPQVIQHIRQATRSGEKPDGVPCLEVPQYLSVMAGPTADFERMVFARDMVHDGNPVMTSCMAAAVVQPNLDGEYRPLKNKSKRKIDGAVAAVMARAVSMAPEDDNERSVYEDRGALVI